MSLGDIVIWNIYGMSDKVYSSFYHNLVETITKDRVISISYKYQYFVLFYYPS